LATSQYG